MIRPLSLSDEQMEMVTVAALTCGSARAVVSCRAWRSNYSTPHHHPILTLPPRLAAPWAWSPVK